MKPEAQMATLFEGLTRIEQLALLGRLEMAGGQLYRGLAADEQNIKAREALLKAAGDEERTGQLLALMSTPKEACEKCSSSLPIPTAGFSCSFQCAFWANCATEMALICPNCGGALESRNRLSSHAAQ
jgi:hypothetical protein